MVLDQPGSIDAAPLRLREVEPPEPKAGEVCIRVNVCALCRTDLHVVEGDLPAVKLPVIPGHQGVGVVSELGPGCSRLRLGQRVGIAWLRWTDGTCKFCRSGRENLCPASCYTGYHADGGYAEYATVPEDFAYELPEGLDDVAISPLLCGGIIGYRALQRAEAPAQGRLLLVGYGSSAHIVQQIAQYRGHGVYVLSRSDDHQQMARDLGASWVGDDAAKLPMKVHSAILFAPVGNLVPPVLEKLDHGGTLAIAGIHLSDVPALAYERHLFYEKQIRSVTANTRQDGRELLAEAMAAGVKPMTRTYARAAANRGWADLKHSRVNGTGVLVIGS